MLTLSDVFRGQVKYGVSSVLSTGDTISYELYLAECRRMLADKVPQEYYNWDKKRRNEFQDNLIIGFVRNNVKSVDGFMSENGELSQDLLVERLRTDILDFGILRNALEDDTIQEVQINDYKTVWVVRNGRCELYTDAHGKPIQFVSDEELRSTIDRIIYNSNGSAPRMTDTDPLLNARTSDRGYRVSAVRYSATTPDMRAGLDFPVTTVTIRKYAPSMLTFDDFVAGGTMTEDMAQFLRLCGRANIRLMCVGPVSSGKTTLLNAIVWEIPREQRIILIQNPTEIMVYERSEETAANLRNTLHWEAKDIDESARKSPTTQTMGNLISHSLRNAPDVIVPGEVRTPEEFYQMNRALKTGHRVLSTFHARDGADAIERMATELATLGGSITDYVNSLCKSIDIVVSQMKLEDGSRRVMKIEELTGRVNEDGTIETRTLFEFKLSGKVDRDENGRTKKIHGTFQRVEPLSKELLREFYTSGIGADEMFPYTEEGFKQFTSQSSPAVTTDTDDVLGAFSGII